MIPQEQNYFVRMSNYKPKEIKTKLNDYQIYIDDFSRRIRNTAKDALSGQISPNNAQKEISDLLDDIKILKKGEEIK
jgi:hypothetical protein